MAIDIARTLKLGLLGNNLSRSRAQDLHQMIGELVDVRVTYTPMDLESRGAVTIDAELRRCAGEGFDGVNITHPYKSGAFAAVANTAALPPGLTTINTVRFDDGNMTGFNTDYSGFVRAFRAVMGADARPGRVLMLGCGGVGKAIAFALTILGATELAVHDVRAVQAMSLIDELARSGLPVRLAGADLARETVDADGLVNATPTGMFRYPGCAFPESAIGGQQWAFDAVYTPENTAFLDACRKRGVATLSGFKLFLYQGLDAFEVFSGIALDADRIESEFLRRFRLE